MDFFKLKNYYKFNTGRLYCTKEMSEDEYIQLQNTQQETPVCIMSDSESNKKWWMF